MPCQASRWIRTNAASSSSREELIGDLSSFSLNAHCAAPPPRPGAVYVALREELIGAHGRVDLLCSICRTCAGSGEGSGLFGIQGICDATASLRGLLIL